VTPPTLSRRRTVHDSRWFCASWRGGCGAPLPDHKPAGSDPCPHCGEYAATRYRLIEPDPAATATEAADA